MEGLWGSVWGILAAKSSTVSQQPQGVEREREGGRRPHMERGGGDDAQPSGVHFKLSSSLQLSTLYSSTSPLSIFTVGEVEDTTPRL